MKSFFAITSFVTLYSLVNGHGLILAVNGANGVATPGFGVVATTPRDGTRRRPFQQDTSIIRDREIESGEVGPCGRTLLNGNVNLVQEMQNAMTNGLAEASADGMVSMTFHQVNGDGAGPFTCDIDASGTGNNFVAMTVVQDVPGRNSRSRNDATDFPLVAQMPAGMTCAGSGGACLVRCRNSARAGPFGSCVAVTNNGGAAAAPPAVAPPAVAPPAAAPPTVAPPAVAPPAVAPPAVTPPAVAPPAAGNGTASTGGTIQTGNVTTTPASNTGASNSRNGLGGNVGGSQSNVLKRNKMKKIRRIHHEKELQRRSFAKSV